MNYEKLMAKCIQLAKNGEGKVAPNPLVGCIALDKNGKILSKGYHKKYGKAHAEVNTLKYLPEGACHTLIVTLEPCCHWGKTPPCTDLIIKKKVKKVVVGMHDPNPLVNSQGIRTLKNAGIEVVEGVLQKECEELNEIFIKNIQCEKIFVAIKTATTIDGKIATKTGDSKWITSETSREIVQKIRNRYDAILTTSETIIKDNPSLTCRLKGGKNPIKIILDRTLSVSPNAKIFDTQDEKIYIFTDKSTKIEKNYPNNGNIEVIKCNSYNNKLDMKEVLKILYKIGIRSVLIEAGGKLCGDVISNKLADKIYHFIAPKILADNEAINAFYGRNVEKIKDAMDYKIHSVELVKPDIIISYKLVQ